MGTGPIQWEFVGNNESTLAILMVSSHCADGGVETKNEHGWIFRPQYSLRHFLVGRVHARMHHLVTSLSVGFRWPSGASSDAPYSTKRIAVVVAGVQLDRSSKARQC